MPFDPTGSVPLLTADLPGIHGRVKVEPEDFDVEEIPAYQPSGAGDFLYLWIEKRDMGAEFFVRQIAQRLGVSIGDIGTAGLKDRRAVTRQMVSVPAAVESRLAQLEGDCIRVLNVSRHTNKLKTGHLRGNRFQILIRDVDPAAEQRVPPLLERLNNLGMPNFYGPQRFGHEGETARLGFSLLRQAPVSGRRPSPFLRRLALSAAQSTLFNHYLGKRISDGLFRVVLPGDVMAKWPFGGLFVAEDVEREQSRFDARETVTAGPIFGRKTFPAKGVAAEREAEVLREAQLTAASFAPFGKLALGTRRHNIIYPENLSAQLREGGLQLTFALPSGSYATILLREIMKSESIAPAEDDEPS